MYNVKNIKDDIIWIGANDMRLERFENMFPLPNGVSYNSYVILDEKTALLDTADAGVGRQFLINLEHTLENRDLDYLIVNHTEPDHCAFINDVIDKYPNVKVLGNKKTFQFLNQFYEFKSQDNFVEVKENDEISLGKRTLKFYFAPMVHWPEVMFTYEKTDKILFSADAFGTFGGFTGNLFTHETNFKELYLDDARRYYSNIVGKYGFQVQNALKKFKDVEIEMICPLHGPLWSEDIPYIMEKYNLWSTYAPEEKGVLILYGSMYGNTENVATIIGSKLSEKGVKDIRIHDISKTHTSYIISDFWKYSHVVLAAPTYNNSLYPPMDDLLNHLEVLNAQNRKVSIVGNGSWAPISHNKMMEKLENLKNIELVGEPLVIRSSIKEEQLKEVDDLTEQIVKSL